MEVDLYPVASYSQTGEVALRIQVVIDHAREPQVPLFVVCSAGGVPLACFTDLADVQALVAQEVFERDSVEFTRTGCRSVRGPALPLPTAVPSARKGRRPGPSSPKLRIDVAEVMKLLKL